MDTTFLHCIDIASNFNVSMIRSIYLYCHDVSEREDAVGYLITVESSNTSVEESHVLIAPFSPSPPESRDRQPYPQSLPDPPHL
jgi:hypothetical protein